LVERRGGVGERKLRLLGLKAACEEEADRREKQQRGESCGALGHGENVFFRMGLNGYVLALAAIGSAQSVVSCHEYRICKRRKGIVVSS